MLPTSRFSQNTIHRSLPAQKRKVSSKYASIFANLIKRNAPGASNNQKSNFFQKNNKAKFVIALIVGKLLHSLHQESKKSKYSNHSVNNFDRAFHNQVS